MYVRFFLCVLFFNTLPWNIIINTAGDAKYAGRTIGGDYFERGISLQYGEQLKKALEQQCPSVRVMLTRMPGEMVEPLHNAHLANRLCPDLYISLHFFQEQEARGSVFIYYALYNPVTDFWYKPSSELHFLPYNHAHQLSLASSKYYAQHLAGHLRAELSATITVHRALGIPFRPLIGIAVPAVALEIGIQKKTDSDLYIQPLTNAIITQVLHAHKN